jgi:hypothetical protein
MSLAKLVVMARCNIKQLTTHDQTPIFAGFWALPGLLDV